jgi:hypothetical protein
MPRAPPPGGSFLQLVYLAPKSGNTRRGDEYALCARRPSIPTYSNRTRRLKLAPEILMDRTGDRSDHRPAREEHSWGMDRVNLLAQQL